MKLFELLHILFISTSYGQIDGDIRLSGGFSDYEGRLEIYYNGQWGTVCDDYFNSNPNAGIVACRQLGFGGFISQFNANGGTDIILLDDVVCTGSESTLMACSNSGWGNHNCGHSQDVGIICSPLAFQIIYSQYYYSDAVTQCASLGLKLATLHNSQDYTIVEALCISTNDKECWLGGERASTANGALPWYNIDGSSWDYEYWYAGGAPGDVTILSRPDLRPGFHIRYSSYDGPYYPICGTSNYDANATLYPSLSPLTPDPTTPLPLTTAISIPPTACGWYIHPGVEHYTTGGSNGWYVTSMEQCQNGCCNDENCESLVWDPSNLSCRYGIVTGQDSNAGDKITYTKVPTPEPTADPTTPFPSSSPSESPSNDPTMQTPAPTGLV